MGITYGSVCSGIEAATTAWHPLGWIPKWFSEIEPFPSAVLAHHWPDVPNLGDFTAIRHRIATGEIEAPDVLVGGTPCQAFSVAGLRRSLDDQRGQLTLQFVGLADAIDAVRSVRGLSPVTIVWENVPGVLNTPDNAFGCFLAGLVGEDDPLVAPGGRWTNVGYVRGPRRTVAWRILDAQYFGVAQRRRRVFLVASAGDKFRPEQILFEFDGVRRDSPPRREAGKGFARVAGTLTSNGGVLNRPDGNANELDFCIPVNGSHWDGGPRPSLNQSNNIGGVGMSNQEIFSQRGAYLAPCVSAARMTAFGEYVDDGTASTLKQRDYKDETDLVVFGVSEAPDVAHCLRSGASKADKHESTTYVAAPVAPIGLDEEQNAVIDGFGTLKARTLGGGFEGSVMQPDMQVRRLTPTECERLQGFPDGHTRIPWRGNGSEECPDGPRYKALGNSMAVPVMHWIGKRIDRVMESR